MGDYRVSVWYSCGVTSACAAKIVREQCKRPIDVIYCNTLMFEHPDNIRFMRDTEEWIGQRIKILRSSKYDNIVDVFLRTGWLVGHNGARCTLELKRRPREEYCQPGDIDIFGFDADEVKRSIQFSQNNPELNLRYPLIEAGLNKQDCINMLLQAGIKLPAMYELGFKNNNCRICVKGGMGYWNLVRIRFPDLFYLMCWVERKIGFHIHDCYLDELDPERGNYKTELSIECGPVCDIK